MPALLTTTSLTSLLFISLGIITNARDLTWNDSNTTSSSWNTSLIDYRMSSTLIPKEECPPCFNCLLPAYKCGNYGECNEYDGQCRCPQGWSGNDCLTPQCGSLADGDKRRPRPDGKQCECDEGWGGINCNVCQNDNACLAFPMPELDPESSAPNPGDMSCYTGGAVVREQHQMCDVTNRKIVDMLPGRPPQVTFSCNANSSTCAFQFWIGKVESFYCALDTCTSSVEHAYQKNTTIAACEHIKCSCIKDRMLCGEEGSVNIDEFLEQEIKGPAKFSCKTGEGCKFEEPAMNDLIDSIFGDEYITLKCDSGECLHYTQIPGYIPPPKPDYTVWLALSSAGAVAIFLLVVAVFWYGGRANTSEGLAAIRLPEDEAARLMSEHIPAQLNFANISYSISEKVIISGVSGSVKPGQLMAIMGSSGAGKSTLLDILARRQKRGTVGGVTLVNGREVPNSEFKRVVGFVDQEDTLMSTLTVYETVLYSALLRLPREMSMEAKKFRTLETLHELGILGIKDLRIGESGRRSISGGEKRRVSIACELVTSPSILFLDEPTSGLDSYNAFNVIESLRTLARDFNRTVVFTIHQPRSNIVALFDQLVLLAKGQVVYSGPFPKCQSYFEHIGFPCPPGYNIADYLIDLTSNASNATPRRQANTAAGSSNHSERGVQIDSSNQPDSQSSATDQPSHPAHGEIEHGLNPKALLTHGTDFIKQTIGGLSGSTNTNTHTAPVVPPEVTLEGLTKSYRESRIAHDIEHEASSHATVNGGPGNGSGNGGQMRDVAEESTALRGRNRASWPTQFRILSGRAFKNLYRDPLLLTAHYAAAIGISIICGLLLYHVTNDIPGFQNRLGFFFFTLALFGFSSLSSLSHFANERVLFMRERANGYYSSFTYFTSKVLFDILPLRVVPALVYGSITYGLVGLVPTLPGFWKFLLTLVLFNLTTASVVLFVSVAIANTAVASLAGTLIMLYNLLFAGLLVNRDTVNRYVDWLHVVSFFHAAYEAFAVNELRYLTLKENKFGVVIDVPAATVLNEFGFHAQAFWWPDMVVLGICFASFMVLSFLWLHFYVKEKR